jgi:predicted Zn-dependent protease
LEECIKYANLALFLNPNDILPIITKGQALFSMGELKRAAQTLKLGLQIEPNNPIVNNILCDVMVQLKRLPDALDYLNAALKDDNNN